ncbi:MAG: helix-turn-helix domain-containing protein [Desulfovibrio sp.]|uniref:helix-turn-helix domain-containing protein n=1 Tax=Desulfovibrio sp. TaxID=885 RepID=UPI0039E62994
MPTPLDRFFEATGCRTQVELAEFLGIRQSSIADAKKRGNIPSAWLLTLWRKRRVNPDWILTGQESKNLFYAQFEDLTQQKIHIKEISPPESFSIE